MNHTRESRAGVKVTQQSILQIESKKLPLSPFKLEPRVQVNKTQITSRRIRTTSRNFYNTMNIQFFLASADEITIR